MSPILPILANETCTHTFRLNLRRKRSRGLGTLTKAKPQHSDRSSTPKRADAPQGDLK